MERGLGLGDDVRENIVGKSGELDPGSRLGGVEVGSEGERLVEIVERAYALGVAGGGVEEALNGVDCGEAVRVQHNTLEHIDRGLHGVDT